jgi:glycosyltransferase involved in cell wall biosynthesis
MRIVRYYPRALIGDGGMTGAVRRWAGATVRAGAQVLVAYDGGHPPGNDGVEWRPLRHTKRGALHFPIGLDEVLEGADLLVLHSGWTWHNARAAAMARSMGVPYLLEPRGAYDPSIVSRNRTAKKAWWVAVERRLVRGARAIHAFFDQERAHLRSIGYAGPIVVVPNGADIATAPLWNGSEGSYALWLGRFDPEHKGLDLLLRSLLTIPPAERPALKLCGPDWHGRKAGVHRMIASLGLSDRVHVEDAVYGDDKRAMLVAAAAFAYPSRWDACPNSVLEAISLGLPTLVTPYPLGRFLADRGAAVLAEPTPAALAAGIRRVLEPNAARVGARGMEVARADLGWDTVARSWLRQVEDVL